MTKDWPTTTLGTLFNMGAGKSVTPAARYGERRHPFLRTANILWGRVDLTEVDTMHFDDDEIASKSLQKGDLLVCEGGDIGRSAIWNGEIPNCSFQNHLHRLRPKTDEILARFFMYYLQAGFTQLGIYEGAGNKTTIPNLSRNRLAALDVPKPPKLEQEKIAAVLWKAQKAVETEERLITTARELKQSAMHRLFTRGLRSEPQKETEIGLMPESWEVKDLGDAALVIMGQSPPGESYNESGIGTPLINGPVEFRPNSLDLTLETKFTTQPTKFCETGDLILCVRGSTTGRTNVAASHACIGRGVAAIRSHQDQPFLNQYMTSIRDNILAMGTGATFPNVSTDQIKRIRIPMPSPSEQSEIANILQTIVKKISVHERKRATLQELFKTLLHELMTGRVRVSHLDIDTSEIKN